MTCFYNWTNDWTNGFCQCAICRSANYFYILPNRPNFMVPCFYFRVLCYWIVYLILFISTRNSYILLPVQQPQCSRVLQSLVGNVILHILGTKSSNSHLDLINHTDIEQILEVLGAVPFMRKNNHNYDNTQKVYKRVSTVKSENLKSGGGCGLNIYWSNFVIALWTNVISFERFVLSELFTDKTS